MTQRRQQLSFRAHTLCSAANHSLNKQPENEKSKPLWVTCSPCRCALLTTWSLKRLTEPIVVAWLLAVCFSGSLIRRRKTEWAPRTVALLDQRLQDRIKWFPLLRWELLLPLCKTPAPSQDYYFWQCLPQEGTFADLMGPGPLYAAFCMAPCHHFHREEREGEKNWGMCLKSIQNKTVPVYVILNTSNIFQTLHSLWRADELKWFFICMEELLGPAVRLLLLCLFLMKHDWLYAHSSKNWNQITNIFVPLSLLTFSIILDGGAVKAAITQSKNTLSRVKVLHSKFLKKYRSIISKTYLKYQK